MAEGVSCQLLMLRAAVIQKPLWQLCHHLPATNWAAWACSRCLCIPKTGFNGASWRFSLPCCALQRRSRGKAFPTASGYPRTQAAPHFLPISCQHSPMQITAQWGRQTGKSQAASLPHSTGCPSQLNVIWGCSQTVTQQEEPEEHTRCCPLAWEVPLVWARSF